MADNEHHNEEAILPGANNQAAQRIPLQDHFIPGNEEYDTIRFPGVEANSFNINPAVIQMVASDPFRGGQTEDPNTHIVKFSRICGTFKINGVNSDAIKLFLFPFSLKDIAQRWLSAYPTNHFTNWEQLRGEFLKKFFPVAKTQKLRRDIQQFKQQTGEPLADAWERFKELGRQCPHHGLPDWALMMAFYDGLSESARTLVDASAGGSFAALDPNENKELLEKIASNGSTWHSERSTPKTGMHEVDQLTALSAKMDSVTTMINRLAKVTLNNQTANSVNSNLQEPAVICGICQGNHEWGECLINPQPTVEHVDQVGFNRNQNWQGGFNQNRNHPGFSWSNPNGAANPPQNQFPRSNNMEIIMTKMLNEVQQLAQGQQQLKDELQQLKAHNKMLETQIANQPMASQPTGRLPAQPENPRHQVNAIMTRSGKQLQDPSPQTYQKAKPSETEADSTELETDCNQPTVQNSSTTKNVSEQISSPKPIREHTRTAPFPERLAKQDNKWTRFLKVIDNLNVSVPLLDLLSQVPSYAKILKEMIASKKKIPDKGEIAIAQHLQELLPTKRSDPGTFSIPCLIGGSPIAKALCDLGASVSIMPVSLALKLGLGAPKLVPNMKIQFADRRSVSPLGILEDVPVQVDKYFVPCDFIVMDIEEDALIPIILGRPFLATAGAMIDARKGSIVFDFGEERVAFNIIEETKNPEQGKKRNSNREDKSKTTSIPDAPPFTNDCFAVDVIDECVQESWTDLLASHGSEKHHLVLGPDPVDDPG